MPGGAKVRARRCLRTHVNSLWSVWYGVIATALQAYVALQAARRFLGFVSLPWAVLAPPPRAEVHAVCALTVAAAVLLPFFLAAALLRVGNLANDGVKLGHELAACSSEPVALVAAAHCGPGLAPHPLRVLWLHGGPTAPFLHVVTALLLLAPRLCMEARLIQAGFLPKESLFRPDLSDWGLRPDRLMSLAGAGAGAEPHHDLGTSLATTLAPLNATPRYAAPRAATAATGAPRVAPLYLLDRGLKAWALPPGELQDAEAWATLSPELLNYGLALLVYAVRYPAVFWRGNKTFGALFSVQLMANGAQCLLAWLGAATLYKVQVYGAASALPTALGAAVLRAMRQGQHGHGAVLGLGLGDPGGGGMLLSPGVTLGLLGLGTLLVLASSLVLYLYGYGRLHAFLQTEAAKRVIRVRPRSHGWVCFTHCAALCVLACACVVQAPLVHDWLLLYRGSLDTAVLAALSACILLLLSWLGLWLLLTLKSRWTFKLRVTVAQAVVRSARSVRLCTEVELRQHRGAGGDGVEGAEAAEAAAPLLVVGNGRAYTVADPEPRSAILAVIGKSQQERRARMNGGAGPSAPTGAPGAAGAAGGAAPGGATDPNQPGVYWLRPGGASGPEEGVAWMGRKASKPKVTFDEATTKRHHDGGSPPVLDDGDYALLQELPLVATPAKHSTGSAGACAAAETSGPAKAPAAGPAAGPAPAAAPQSHLGAPRGLGHEDPSPLLTPEPLTIASDLDDEAPLPDLDDLPPPPPNVTGSVSDRSEASSSGGDSSGCATITGSPPGAHRSDHSSHSDTSGVHSSSSNASHIKLYEQLKYDPQQQQHTQQQQQQARRASSIQDLCLDQSRPPPPQYKSFSLTRGLAPPGPTAGLGVAPLPAVLKLQSQPIYSSIRKPSQGVTLKPPQPALADEDDSPPPPAPADPMRVPMQHHKPLQPLQPVREEATPTGSECGGGGGVPATLQVNGHDDTVVIRRHKQAPQAAKEGEEEKFGRATNMRMTSFTDQPDHGRGGLGGLGLGQGAYAGAAYGYAGYGYGHGGMGAGAANTLPLPPPPQPPPAAQPHCATLPAHGAAHLLQQHQQHQQQQQQLASSCGNFVRQHSTIPTHHNGVMLYQPGLQSLQAPLQAPLQAQGARGPPAAAPASALGVAYFKDHSMSPALKYGLQQHLQQHLRAGVGVGVGAADFQNGGRDSANFSMTSSGDGEYAH